MLAELVTSLVKIKPISANEEDKTLCVTGWPSTTQSVMCRVIILSRCKMRLNQRKIVKTFVAATATHLKRT